MVADEELLREWQSGSASALEALVQRHHAPLLAHLVRLSGDIPLAEDIVQETFIRLVREAHTYRYPRPFKPWFYSIARHLVLNHWQSAYHRHVDVDTEAASGERRSDDPDPADWMERLEWHKGMQAALARLSVEQREVLSLRFGQELSVEEAAAVIGVPAGTVKSRTFTALRRLRDMLEQTSSETSDAQGVHRYG